MFIRGRFGVGRIVHSLAGRSFSSAWALPGSLGGTPSAYQAGSCELVRRTTAPGLPPYFAVPAASAFDGSTRHIQAPDWPSNSTLSSRSTAALVKKFTGTSGASLPLLRKRNCQRFAVTSYVHTSTGKRW